MRSRGFSNTVKAYSSKSEIITASNPADDINVANYESWKQFNMKK